MTLNKTYNIGFAFGDPECGYLGDSWGFRITNNKLRLWHTGGIGGGCGGNFVEFKTPGKLNTYPNELENYKFFDRGKLQGLKLVIGPRYFGQSEFSEGLKVVILDGGRFGFIDKTGEAVLTTNFDVADDFRKGLAWIQQGGMGGNIQDAKYGYIDKTGAILSMQTEF